jgi:hypothetical protein
MNPRSADRILDLADDWRRLLAHPTILTTPEWLATDDEGRTATGRYVVRDGPGEPGGLIAQCLPAGAFPTNDPLALLLSSELEEGGDPALRAEIEQRRKDLAGPLGEAYPAAISVLPGGYLPGLVGARTPATVDALLSDLDELGTGWQCPVSAVLHVADDDPLGSMLADRGWIGVAALAQAEMGLGSATFEEHVTALPKRRRNKVRRERREFAAAGLVVREDTIGARKAEMARLHAEQLQSYGHHQVTAERLQGLLDRIERHLSPWCRILVAEREGALEAFTLSYEYGGELHLKMTGFSAYAKEHFGYFAMCYYELVADALSRGGVHTVVYGPLAYPAKVVRGCRLAPRSTYLRVPAAVREPVAELAARLDRHNRDVFAALGERDR